MTKKQINKPLRDLIDIIHFTESVSTKIHGLFEEDEIYQMVEEEFAGSRKYSASIVLLTNAGSKLKIAETSLSPKKLKSGERLTGVRLEEYKINLGKSRLYRQVVKEGKTVQADVGQVIAEIFPRPLASLITKAMGYDKKLSILTPLKRNGKIIGAFAMTSTDLAEYFIPSVKNLARHISTALELAHECKRRKKAEEALRQLVESQKEFIAHVGHELRTPLSVIKAAVEAELDEVRPPQPTPLTLVNKKVDQISFILRNLMLVSRLDIGQEKVRKTKLGLKDLLKEVSHDVIQESKREKIHPVVELNCSPKLKLKTDRTKLSEVLTNLLRNAIVHANGQPLISLGAKKTKGFVQITVEDNNQPIPKQKLEKIFERYYRRKKRGKKAPGLGLGLHISKRLVELMEGKIWAESKRRGNRFVVQLPTSS